MWSYLFIAFLFFSPFVVNAATFHNSYVWILFQAGASDSSAVVKYFPSSYGPANSDSGYVYHCGSSLPAPVDTQPFNVCANNHSPNGAYTTYGILYNNIGSFVAGDWYMAGFVTGAATTYDDNGTGTAYCPSYGGFYTTCSGTPVLQVFSTTTGTTVFDSSTPGFITGTTTWVANSYHLIATTTTINAGVTLFIEPGAVVKFLTSTTSLIVNGTLDDEGSSATSTYLTSYKDDLYGGDSNGDGNATAPAASDWGGIQVNSGGKAIFSHAFIGYGGSVGGSNAMIYNNGGIITISASSSVQYGATYGIRNSSGSITVTNSDISHSTYGMYVDGGNATTTDATTVHDNSSYGLYNATGATSSLFAENIYWATSTGPYNAGSNPQGGGDAVSNNIDFSPWITSLHFIQQDTQVGCSGAGTCDSVNNGRIILYATSTYQAALDAATSTWNSLSPIVITSTTTSANADVMVEEVNRSDVLYTAHWHGVSGGQDTLELNSYFLAGESDVLRENSILHELGHALGLDHSYWGNIMYFSQTDQINLGAQDKDDYHYLWGY